MADTPDFSQFFQISASGGVRRSLKSARELKGDELCHVENGTIRGGLVTTRPGYRWIPDFHSIGTDVAALRGGKIQGSAYYGFASGALFVYAIDGHLFGFNPITGEVFNLNPEPAQAPFSRLLDFVYFEERADFLVAGDGINTSVIIDGVDSRHANNTAGEIGVGLMMADGWGYLVQVAPCRRRILISENEQDPRTEVGPLTFSDDSPYYLEADAFTVPRRIGRITGLAFVPWAETDTGVGPLAVFGETGVVTYNLAVPRVSWLTSDISSIALNRTGGVGHRAITEWGNDLYFSDAAGRIRTLRTAGTDESTRRVRYTDGRVSEYYTDAIEDASLRRWRIMAAFDNRVFTTIRPQARWITDGKEDRFSVYHEALVVWEGDVTETTDLTSERDIWAGVWTGARFATLDVGLFAADDAGAGEEYCVGLSVDPDGVNRFYRITKSERDDWGPDDASSDRPRRKRIQMTMVPGRSDFGQLYHPKRIDRAYLDIDEIRGKTTIQAFARVDSDSRLLPWFKHTANVCEEIVVLPDEDGVCRVEGAEETSLPLLSAPRFTPAGSQEMTCMPLEAFRRFQPVFVFTGHVCVSSFGIEVTGRGALSAKPNTDCSGADQCAHISHCKEALGDITYNMLDAVTAGPPRKVTQGSLGDCAPIPGYSGPTPDNDSPEITLLGDNPVELFQGQEYVEPGYQASDPEDGNITDDVMVTGTVDTDTPGSYELTYTVTDSGGLSDQVTRTVNVIEVLFYFASPTGDPDGDGSNLNPWDLRAGVANVPAGETLQLMDGVFDEPIDAGCGQPVRRKFEIASSNVIVRPATPPSCDNPFPAQVLGGFSFAPGTSGSTVRDVITWNLDPVPNETVPGIPLGSNPQDNPDPALRPPCWLETGFSGTNTEGSNPADNTRGHRILNTHTQGGLRSGLSTFQAYDITYYGNSVYDWGWYSTDFAVPGVDTDSNGHGVYMQNPSNDPADRCRFVRNMVGGGSRSRDFRGQWALQFFKSSGPMQNWDIVENFAKGAFKVEGGGDLARSVNIHRNVFASIRRGATAGGSDSTGNSIGAAGETLQDVDMQDNVYLNAVKRCQSLPGATLVNVLESGTRVVKTDSGWWGTPAGALPPGEVGTWSDVSAGGGVDEFFLQDNEHDANLGQLAILDLDLDGSVQVDFSPLVPPGSRLCLFHFADPLTPVIDTTFTGAPIAVPMVEDPDDAMDMFRLRWE